MPVAMDHPASGQHCTLVETRESEPPFNRVSAQFQCHYCSFGPLDATSAACRCPKCKRHTWDRLFGRLEVKGLEGRRAAGPRMSLSGPQHQARLTKGLGERLSSVRGQS
jgi:hypothetical protein